MIANRLQTSVNFTEGDFYATHDLTLIFTYAIIPIDNNINRAIFIAT